VSRGRSDSWTASAMVEQRAVSLLIELHLVVSSFVWVSAGLLGSTHIPSRRTFCIFI
jgi:hypothetical protein